MQPAVARTPAGDSFATVLGSILRGHQKNRLPGFWAKRSRLFGLFWERVCHRRSRHALLVKAQRLMSNHSTQTMTKCRKERRRSIKIAIVLIGAFLATDLPIAPLETMAHDSNLLVCLISRIFAI